MIAKLKQALFARGFRLLMRPYELNIVGVRSKNRVANSFDDTIYVFYLDKNANWQIHSFQATTDPGTYYLQHPINENGTAILKPNQYLNTYELGMHRQKYLALVQRKPVTVYRDVDKNCLLDFSGQKQETGMFGINIHRAAQQGKTQSVDAHSAGCQVFAKTEDFDLLIRLCQNHKAKYGNSFSYTLMDEAQLNQVLSV
jgi:hypothetical protein